MKKYILKLLNSYRLRHRIRASKADLKEYLSYVKVSKLNNSEKEVINKFWKRYIHNGTPCNLYFYSIYKQIDKFNLEYLPDDIYQPFILPILNPTHEAHTLSNKNIYGFLFKDFNRPFELIRNINGSYYDSNNNPIDYHSTLKIILDYKGKLIIKPTVDTSCGNNVLLIDHPNKNQLSELLDKYKKNFVCQSFIKQSDYTAIFNPSSVNTFRITSLFLNGRFTILSSVFRCGGNNSIVDNVGSGGVMVGVSSDGILNDYGYNSKGNRLDKSFTGKKFSNFKMPNFNKVLEFCKLLHFRIPFCGIVGWDIALDENNNPMLLEVNLKCPGIFYEQMCTGPILGQRFNEVIEYINNNHGFSKK